MAWSNLDSVQAKAGVERVMSWLDKDADGAPNAETLSQGFLSAQQTILSYISDRYGAQCLDWDIDTVPDALRTHSDALSIWYFATGSNAVNDIVQVWHDLTMQFLENIRDGLISIPGVSDATDYDSATAELTDGFDSISTDYVDL